MGRQKNISRILVLLLALIMTIGMIPATAAADTMLEVESLVAAKYEKSALGELGSALNANLLSKGIDAKSNLTAARTAEELSYVESVAVAFTEPVGIYGLESIGNDETVEVFVWLQSLPDALERVYNEEKMDVSGYSAVKSEAQAARNSIKSLARNRSAAIKITYEYTEVFSGFAIETTRSQLDAIANMPGVYMITEVGYAQMDDYSTYTPDPNYTTPGNGAGREVTEIADLHAAGIDGRGVKVGVIDSGIDATHPDLVDAYKGGYNYADTTADMTRQDGSHGTHVSGTIASQGINSLGVAPGVDLYMAQVFTATRPNSASQADIKAAIEAFTKGDAAKGLPKVDIINMSLGVATNTAYSSELFVRNNAIIDGVLIVCSGGNEADTDASGNKVATNRRNYTVGSGGVSLPLTVAAAQHGSDPAIVYGMTASNDQGESSLLDLYVENKQGSTTLLFKDDSFTFTNIHEVTYTAQNTVSGPNVWMDAEYYGTYTRHPLVYVEGKGYELYYACSTAGDMSAAELTALKALPKDSLIGKILVVNRGQNFNSYLGEALRLGAGAMIVLNRDEEYIVSMLSGFASAMDIAVFSGPVSDRQKLLSVITAGGKAYLDPTTLTRPDALLEPADFSSIGPVNETAQIKPDVIAPGDWIFSTSLNGGYELMGGTSMSSPFVAGVAALVKQAYPNAAPAEIKARIMNTSDPDLLKPLTGRLNNPVYYFNASGTEMSVYEQGAGFVNPKRAVYEDVYITVLDNNVPTGNPNKSVMSADMGSFSFGNSVQGQNTGKLTATVHGADDYTISVRYNNNTRYSRSSEGAVTVKYEIKGNTFDVWLEVAETASTDAKLGNLYEGYIVVTVGGADYVLPWATRVGEAPKPPVDVFPFDYSFLSRPMLSLGANRMLTTGTTYLSNASDFYFKINQKGGNAYFIFETPEGEALGELGVRLGLGTATVGGGYRQPNFINGTYYKYANDAGELEANLSELPDGHTVCRIWMVMPDGNWNTTATFDIFIDRTPPVLTIDNLVDGNKVYYTGDTLTITGNMYDLGLAQMEAAGIVYEFPGWYADQSFNMLGVSINGAAYQGVWPTDANGNFSIPLTGVSGSSNTISFRAIDSYCPIYIASTAGTATGFSLTQPGYRNQPGMTNTAWFGANLGPVFTITLVPKPLPTVTSFSVVHKTYVAGLPARMSFNAAGTTLEDAKLSVVLSDGVSDLTVPATITEGSTTVYYDTMPTTSGTYTAKLLVDGAVAKTDTFTILPYDTSIWTATAYAGEGDALAIKFNAAFSLTASASVKIDGQLISGASVDGTSLIIPVLYDDVKAGAKIVITGVKYPELFPSYSFTFTVAK